MLCSTMSQNIFHPYGTNNFMRLCCYQYLVPTEPVTDFNRKTGFTFIIRYSCPARDKILVAKAPPKVRAPLGVKYSTQPLPSDMLRSTMSQNIFHPYGTPNIKGASFYQYSVPTEPDLYKTEIICSFL